jgi:hypothetical protein
VPWVTPHTSLELPGRAAHSRGRTSTGEFQSIHGILSGTVFAITERMATLYQKRLPDARLKDELIRSPGRDSWPEGDMRGSDYHFH